MLIVLKNFVGSIPVLGPALRKGYAFFVGRPSVFFKRSDQYWEDRYRSGGNSGSGSYGRLAEFKAQFLNEFVRKKEIGSIVEFGCGDGAQLCLADYPNYVGFDVAMTSIDMCREKFSNNSNYEFYLVGTDQYKNFQPVDLALSLDVIYHLIEDDIFDAYMRKLFASARRYVVIYAYDFERTYASRHELGRKFTLWIERNAPDWLLIQKVPNPYPYDHTDPNNTSQSDFFVYAPKT